MLSPSDIVAKKQKGEKVSMITAYDFAFARMAEEAGVDQILVGDSLANTMLGYKSTREIGMTEMLIFASAVCRGAPNTHVIGDMPYLSDKDPQTAYDNARRFMDVGCASIKLEGTPEGVIEFLRSKDIPVCAHHGLLPQTAENFKQKGRTAEEAAAIEAAAKFTDSLGCFEMVLEHIPEELGKKITDSVKAVTIGIGGGKFTNGHVLVMHDALGMHPGKIPPFATKFVDMYSLGVEGFKKYVDSVSSEV
ncbi:MAG: 3-methyl-2-oxobutanoate hydroxymethyltransferase [Fibrobacter sp.]|nr:3-methyl-2-oxobutanoate hydroxymethyltransferase [Fibrobacter sp.]